MNELELAAALRRVCAVDASAVARVRNGLPKLAARASTLPPVALPRQRRRRWPGLLFLAAAVALLPLLRPFPDRTLRIHLGAQHADPAFDEPPGLAGLAARADVILAGAASAVQPEQIEFTVQRVLRGDALLRTVPLRRVVGQRDVPWRIGADVLLFLQREPGSGELVSVGGEEGSLPLLAGAIDDLTLDDIAHALAHGGIAPARVVALLATRGPAALSRIEHHCQQFPGWSMPATAPGFQPAVTAWLQQQQPTTVDRFELLTALRWLRPSTAATLDPPTRRLLDAAWPRIRDDGNGLFDAATFLGPFVRADDSLARERLLDVLARIAAANTAAGRLTMHVRHHLELLALQASFDAPAAAHTATLLLDRADLQDPEAVDLLLVHLVRWQAGVGTARALARFRQRFAAGEREVGLAPLLACAPADVAPVLREAMRDDRFGALHLRYDRVLHDVLAATRPNPVLGELREPLRARVAATTATFEVFTNWLRLHREAGGSLAAATALRHYLTDAFPGGFSGLEFVRMLQEWSGRTVLPCVEPTADELAAAARALAR